MLDRAISFSQRKVSQRHENFGGFWINHNFSGDDATEHEAIHDVGFWVFWNSEGGIQDENRSAMIDDVRVGDFVYVQSLC